MTRIRLKICCIASEDEAQRAVRAGADAVGLVGRMPSGPGPILDDRIRAIARRVPPGVDSVLLTAETTAAGVVAHHRRCATSAVQLVATVEDDVCTALREAAPGVRIIQVVHVQGPDSLEDARRAATFADALLLDSGRPGAATPELGGTGRVHDWQVSAAIVRAVAVPVFLAGGLRAENVGEAIRTVRPYGVDLCTGVRKDDALDDRKLAAFCAAVETACAS